MALRKRVALLCLRRVVTVWFALSLLTGYLYALAPKTKTSSDGTTLMLTPEGKEHLEFATQLARMLKVELVGLLDAFFASGIPKHQLNALILSLKYLWEAQILSGRSLQQWETSSLSAKVSALLALAWAAEHQHLWLAKATGPLDPYWESIRLDSLIARKNRPPARLIQRIEKTFDLLNFSTETFFEHPLLRTLPQSPKGRMQKLSASTHGWNNPSMLEMLSLVFLHPYFAEQLSNLIEQNSAIPGTVSILQRLVQIVPGEPETYRDHVGTIYELSHLQHSFVGRGYEVIDTAIKLHFRGVELTEADVVAVREIDSKRYLFLGEVKTIDLTNKRVGFPLDATLTAEQDQHLFLGNIEGLFPHALQSGDRVDFSKPVHQLLRDLWIRSNILWKAERFLEAYEKGVLIPLMNRGQTQHFGGIVFSVYAGNDPLFEEQIREAVRVVGAKHEGISISVNFVSTSPLAKYGKHPYRARYSLSPDRWQSLQEVFVLRRTREDLQRFQRQIEKETGQVIGVEALNTLLARARGDRSGLLRLLATEGLKKIEKWPEERLAARVRGKDSDRSVVKAPGDQPPVLGFEVEPSAAGTTLSGPFKKLNRPIPEGQHIGMDLNVGWNLLPHEAETSRIWWELSEEINDLLENRVLALGEEEWPGTASQAVVHTEDGHILLRATLVNQEGRGLLFVPAVLVVEEILFYLARRGQNKTKATLLLVLFQQRNLISRRHLKAQIMALKKEDPHRALRLDLSGQLEAKTVAFNEYWTEVPPPLKEQFRERHNNLIESMSDQWDRLASPSITPETIRKAHKKIVGQMRGLRRAIREASKDTTTDSGSPIGTTPAITKERTEPTQIATLPEDSIKPLLSQAEHSALLADLRFLEESIKAIQGMFKASAMLAADKTSETPELDLGSLNLLRVNASPATLADLESTSAQALEEGLVFIRNQLHQTIALVLDTGYPKTPEGRPDYETAAKYANALSSGKVGKFKKEIAALKEIWPGLRGFGRIHTRLQNKIAKEKGREQEETSVLYLETFARLWQVDLSTLLSEELETRDIPIFRAVLDRLDDTETAFRQKTVQGRWKREGFRLAEQELFTGWMHKIIKMFHSLSERAPYPLEETVRPANLLRFSKELDTLEEMVLKGYHDDLSKQKELVLITVNQLRADLHNYFNRVLRPLMGRLRTLKLPGLDEGDDPASAPDGADSMMYAFGLVKHRVDELSNLDWEDLKARFADQDFRVDRRLNVKSELVIDRMAEWFSLWRASNLEVLRDRKEDTVTYKYDLLDDALMQEVKADLENINRFLAGQLPDPFPGLPRPSEEDSETHASVLIGSGL